MAKDQAAKNKLKYNDIVYVTKGKHKGRIGIYDDEDGRHAIIYFGSMFYSDGYYVIPFSNIRFATISDLFQRQSEISNQISSFLVPKEMSYNQLYRRYLLLVELHLIDATITERDLIAQYGVPSMTAKKIFISHSKKDKWIANRLMADLKLLGHDPWVDEFKIKVGESIPKSIQSGIDQADFMIILLSENAVQSGWVEQEWMTKYWDERQGQHTILLPALIEKCNIPGLLKTKKYANFTKSYQEGFREIITALTN